MIRRLRPTDYARARILYEALPAGDTLPDVDTGLKAFTAILAYPGTQIIAAEQGGALVSMATLHMLPNITYSARLYAVVENVVTHPDYRGQGWARKVMEEIATTAWNSDVYKIMLQTDQSRGAKSFYEKLGYTAGEKHGMTLRGPNPL